MVQFPVGIERKMDRGNKGQGNYRFVKIVQFNAPL